jgi:transcriptional regulator GlxA family with amidase domain
MSKNTPPLTRREGLAMTNVITLTLRKSVSNKRKLEKLCEWIDATLEHNKEMPIGWSDLEQHSGLDHVEIQRQFMLHKKSSPMQWIRAQRLEKTKASALETFQLERLSTLARSAN